MLKKGNPAEILEKLTKERYPVYATADITIESGDNTLDEMVAKIDAALKEKIN